ncbi:MAG: M10 family metallopeptidase [Pseudomonadota bacterium]
MKADPGSAFSHAAFCGCMGCSAERGETDAEGSAILQRLFDSGPLRFLDPSGDPTLVGTTATNGKSIISSQEAAGLIARNPLTWAIDGDLEVTYSFATNATAGIGFEEFSEPNKAAVRDILALYAEVSGLTFREVAATDAADFTYKVQSGTTNGGGFFDGENVVVGNVSFDPVAEPGNFLYNLLLHETGHALGLSHPGNYNGAGATYAADAEFFSDSAQFTNLSYFSETNTGADFGFLATLGLHDILAIQQEYGTNTTTRSGNTVYGFNDTTGLDVFDLSADDGRGVAIWDTGGTDTLDFSGSSQGTELDLREGSFSSVNGDTGNVSIAYGVTIENGIGSAGSDLIRGNDVANTLWGGAGNDTIIGGDNSQPQTQADPRIVQGVVRKAGMSTGAHRRLGFLALALLLLIGLGGLLTMLGIRNAGLEQLEQSLEAFEREVGPLDPSGYDVEAHLRRGESSEAFERTQALYREGRGALEAGRIEEVVLAVEALESLRVGLLEDPQLLDLLLSAAAARHGLDLAAAVLASPDATPPLIERTAASLDSSQDGLGHERAMISECEFFLAATRRRPFEGPSDRLYRWFRGPGDEAGLIRVHHGLVEAMRQPIMEVAAHARERARPESPAAEIVHGSLMPNLARAVFEHRREISSRRLLRLGAAARLAAGDKDALRALAAASAEGFDAVFAEPPAWEIAEKAVRIYFPQARDHQTEEAPRSGTPPFPLDLTVHLVRAEG